MMKTRRILARSKRMAGYHVPDYTHGFRRWIGRALNAREHGLTNAYASTMMRPEHARGLTFHAALVADHWLVPSQLPNYTSNHRYYGKKIIVRDVLRHTIEPVLMDVPGACLIYITQHRWPDKEDNPVPLSTLHPVFTTIEVPLGQPATSAPTTLNTSSLKLNTFQVRAGPGTAVAVSAAQSQTDSKRPLTTWKKLPQLK